MVFAIFFGGMFLGLILGFVIMALLANSGDHSQWEVAQVIESYPACAYPPIRKFGPSLEAGPEVFGA